jgi:hypothetical protein
MAAYECGSTDFPSPPYPDSILCPDAVEGENATKAAITMWDILSKVKSSSQKNFLTIIHQDLLMNNRQFNP